MTVKEFIRILKEERKDSRIVRFHTKDCFKMELLSTYVSDDDNYLEIDIG